MRNLKNKFASLLLVFFLMGPLTAGAILLPIGWGIGILTGGVATTGLTGLILPGVAATLAVGAVLSWLTIGGTPGATADTAALMVQLDPKAPLPTPPGWTPAVAPSSQPTPPSTASTNPSGLPDAPALTASPNFYENYSPGAIYHKSNGQLVGIFSNGPPNTYLPPPELSSCLAVSHTGFPGNNAAKCETPGVNCPVGYTASGSTCNLTNPAVVQKPSDSRCFIVRTGNTYAADSNDPDCAAGLPAEFSQGPNSIAWTGKGSGDGGGSAVTNPATGKTTITIAKQNSDGTTTTTTFDLSSPISGAAPGAGIKVEGISEQTKPGVGSLVGSIPGLEIPTDYNRETTQSAVKSAVESIRDKQCGGVGQPACKIDETGTPNGAGAADAGKAALDAVTPGSLGILPWSGSGISFLSDFPTLAGSNDCVNPISWTWMGHALSPDMCAIWGPLKTSLAWFLYALTALYIWKILNSSI